MFRLAALALLILFSSFTQISAENLINNGSFEEGTAFWKNWAHPGLPVGYLLIVSSDIERYEISQAPDGKYFAEVNEASNFSQSIRTYPEENYKLNFAIAKRKNHGDKQWFKVFINGREVFRKQLSDSTFSNNFQYQEIEYTAQLNITTVSFAISGSGCSILLDDVSFSPNPSYAFNKNPMHLITGRVTNEQTGEPLKTMIRYTLNSNPNGYTWSDSLNGNFQLATLNPFFISLSVNMPGYHPVKKIFTFKEMTENLLEIKLKPLTKEKTILSNLFFDLSSANLKPESYPSLDSLTRLLKENPEICIKLTGHTENSGNYKANSKLSEERAKEVKKYLTSRGIEPKRITTEGKGATEPIAEDDSPEQKARNRRVEMEILR